MLDTGAVRDSVWGADGIAQAGRAGPVAGLVIDLSTIEPAVTGDFAARLRAATGMGWVDAPVSGGPEAAEASHRHGRRRSDRSGPRGAGAGRPSGERDAEGSGRRRATAKLVNEAMP